MDDPVARLRALAAGPAPLTTVEASNQALPNILTVTITREQLTYVVSAAYLLSEDNGGRLESPQKLWASYESQLSELGLTFPALMKLYQDPSFMKAIYLRGLRSTDNGLDARMILALSTLSEFSSRRTLNGKLKACGVSDTEYRAWLNYKPFRDRLVSMSEKALKGSVSNSKVALASMASNGDLAAIKFLFEVTGEHDPAQQARFDGERLVRGMAEIMMEYIKDPEVLRTIAGKISVLLAANGVSQA